MWFYSRFSNETVITSDFLRRFYNENAIIWYQVRRGAAMRCRCRAALRRAVQYMDVIRSILAIPKIIWANRIFPHLRVSPSYVYFPIPSFKWIGPIGLEMVGAPIKSDQSVSRWWELPPNRTNGCVSLYGITQPLVRFTFNSTGLLTWF